MSHPLLSSESVVGSNEKTIQGVIDKSGVTRIRIIGDDEDDPTRPDDYNLVPFRLVGTKASVRTASDLLNYHVTKLRWESFQLIFDMRWTS